MNNIVKLSDFDILFADYVQNVLNLAADKVLISYADKGQKAPEFTDNIVFVHTEHERDSLFNYKNRKTTAYNPTTENVTIEQTAMRTLQVEFVIYGKDSDTLLTLLNESFYTSSGKLFLDSNNLAIVSENTEYNNKIHESINGRWWERSDLRLRFYNSISIESTVGTFNSADINITTRF